MPPLRRARDPFVSATVVGAVRMTPLPGSKRPALSLALSRKDAIRAPGCTPSASNQDPARLLFDPGEAFGIQVCLSYWRWAGTRDCSVPVDYRGWKDPRSLL
jgi:hypothetical protein